MRVKRIGQSVVVWVDEAIHVDWEKWNPHTFRFVLHVDDAKRLLGELERELSG